MHFTLADLLVDLVQNAAAAGSSHIDVLWEEADGTIRATVEDDGRGMTPEERGRALSPFYTDGVKHPERKVGLGVPFLKQTVESVGGFFHLESKLGHGTTVGFQVPADNIDLPPKGDLVSAFLLVLSTDAPEVEITRVTDFGDYMMRKSELAEVLGGLETVEQLGLLRQFVESQEDDVWQR